MENGNEMFHVAILTFLFFYLSSYNASRAPVKALAHWQNSPELATYPASI